MLRTALVLSLVLVPTSLLAGGQSLSKPAIVPAGHMVAIASNSYFATLAKLAGNFDAPIIFQYDPENDQLVATINGGRDKADTAKETMELFRAEFEPAIVAMAKDVFGVELTDDNVSVVYVKRKTKKVSWSGKATVNDAKTILVRLKGKYVMP